MAQRELSLSDSFNTKRSLECSICLSLFTKPKLFPCLHSFCLLCLKGYCEKIFEKEKPCPLCRRKFVLPEGGVEMLKDDEMINKLIIVQKIKDCNQIMSKCYTYDCEKVELKGKLNGEGLERVASDYCDQHMGEEIKLYCCDCEKLLCDFCFTHEHSDHMCKVPSELAKLKIGEFTKDWHSIAKCMDDELKRMDNLNIEFKARVDEICKTQTSIEESFAEIISHLSEQKSKLVASLEKTKTAEVESIEMEKKVSQLRCRELESFLSYSKMILEQGTDFEIMRVSRDLHEKAEELICSQDERNKQEAPKRNVNFIKPALSRFSWIRNFVLKTGLSLQKTLALTEGLVTQNNSKEEKVITFENKVIGLTIVDDQLLILQDKQSDIKVYDLQTLKSRPELNIKLPNLKTPQCLANCSHNQLIFISDSGLDGIHAANLIDGGVTFWKVKYSYPRGLFLTLEHNILVTVSDKGSRVLEYTGKGNLIRDIELDKSIERAWQTVQLSTDLLLTCHGAWVSTLHRLCVINYKGEIMKTYGGEGGRGKGKLHVPRALALETNHDLLFVADNYNHRVLVFSRDFTFLGQVQTREKLLNPSCVYFDCKSDRLFICEYESGRVLIIKTA